MRAYVIAFVAALIASSGRAADFDRASVEPGADLSAYSVVEIAPVKIALAGARPVAPQDAAAKAADLERALRTALAEKGGGGAATPGIGVLTVEATLTRLVANRPTVADIAARPELSHQSVYAGGAAFRAQLIENGRVLATIEDDYKVQFDADSPPVATWRDADRAFSYWARSLADFLRER